MCTETRYRVGLCKHIGFRTFDYCSYATNTYDEQYRPTKKVCAILEKKAFEVPGLCRECGERALKAEAELNASRARSAGKW